MAAGHARRFRSTHKERTQGSHFLFQEPGRGVYLLAFERVAADEFAEGVGFVGRGA
jgi:hypothetical protein